MKNFYKKHDTLLVMGIEEFKEIFFNTEKLKAFTSTLVKLKLRSKDWAKTSNVLKLIRENCSTKCACCGIEAKYFVIGNPKRDKNNTHSMLVCPEINGGFSVLTFDHVIPKSLGGSWANCNGEVLCDKCNRAKSNTFKIHEMIKVLNEQKYLMMIGYDKSQARAAINASLQAGPIKIWSSRVSLVI